MRCMYPRTVGFKADGRTISWSPKSYDKQYATFQLPCGKCLECRLEYGRSTAIRCVHEAKMYDDNCFITLTYSEENLSCSKLSYPDFQAFVKNLRWSIFQKLLHRLYPNCEQASQLKQWRSLAKEAKDHHFNPTKIGIFATGEYGDEKKRPHWHALIFNYKPSDMLYRRSTDRGDQIYQSASLDALWGHNDPKKAPTEIGDVTFHSAGYCARYAAKKLIHGHDQNHDFHPIHKRSSHSAIGKKYIEQYWPEVFNSGFIILDQQKCPIPRYYEKWLKKHQPTAWADYVTGLKNRSMAKQQNKQERINHENNLKNLERRYRGKTSDATSRAQAKHQILTENFKRLQGFLKGDL